MSIRTTMLIVCLTVLMSACSGSTPPSKGEPQTLETACDKANEGKRIAVEGYLMLPEQVTGDFSVVLRVASTPDRSIASIVSTTVRIDKERKAPNTMDNLGKTYTDNELKFRSVDGQTLGYQDKVRVSGTMYFPSSVANVEFRCGLDNPLIEKV